MTISLSGPLSATATPASAAAAARTATGAAARTTTAATSAPAGAGAAASTTFSSAAGASGAPTRLPTATSRRLPSGTRARRLCTGRGSPSTLLAAFARGPPRTPGLLLFFVHQLCLTLRFAAWHDGDLQLECARIGSCKEQGHNRRRGDTAVGWVTSKSLVTGHWLSSIGMSAT
jgi:hypothetical protein